MTPQTIAAVALMSLGGLWILVACSATFLESLFSHIWEATEGEITLSIMRRRYSRSTGDNVVSERVTLVPDIRYSYIVDGSEYEGHRISISSFQSNLSFPWEGFLGQIPQAKTGFPVGTKVQVYYNPAKPHKSVLKSGVSFSALVGIFIGLFALLFGVSPLLAKAGIIEAEYANYLADIVHFLFGGTH